MHGKSGNTRKSGWEHASYIERNENKKLEKMGEGWKKDVEIEWIRWPFFIRFIKCLLNVSQFTTQ